jgi:hypothetical protein
MILYPFFQVGNNIKIDQKIRKRKSERKEELERTEKKEGNIPYVMHMIDKRTYMLFVRLQGRPMHQIRRNDLRERKRNEAFLLYGTLRNVSKSGAIQHRDIRMILPQTETKQQYKRYTQ